MVARIRSLLLPPVFEEDEEKTRVARLLHVILMGFMIFLVPTLVILLILFGFPTTWEEAYTPMGILVILTAVVGMLAAARRGYVKGASLVFVLIIWSFITVWDHAFSQTIVGGNRIVTSSNLIYLLCIVLAGLLLGGVAARLTTAATLFVTVGASIGRIAYAESVQDALFDLMATVVVTALVGLTQAYAVNNMKRALDTSRRSRAALGERTRELEASQRVTFAASERTTPGEILGLVVNLIRDQFDLYHAQVYIVDEERQAAVLRRSTGYAGRQLLRQEHQIPLPSPALVTKAIRESEPVLVNDVSLDPDFMPNPLLPETRSELVVPLKVGGISIGALDVQARTPGRFTESTVALFQTMADQVAFLFENSELLTRVTEQADELTKFTNQLRTAADIARRLVTILDPAVLLQEVVEMMQSRFGLYHAHIYLLDEEKHQLVVRAGSGEVGRVLVEQGHRIMLGAKQSLVARAVRDQETVLVNDTSLDSDFLPNPLLPQTRSEVAVPLVVGDKVLGVLDVQDDEPERFAEIDLDTFSTLAGQIATALQNANLFEQVGENLAATQARFSVSQALAGAQTEEQVLEAMIRVSDFYPQSSVQIYLVDQDAEALSYIVARSASLRSGIPTPIEQGLRFTPAEFPLLRYVTFSEPFVTENVARDERIDPQSRAIASRMGIVSAALVPVTVGTEMMGVVVVAAQEEGYFDDRKLYLYHSLAGQGATALRIARLYDETQRTAERLREVDRLKSEFLGNMSHELRTPLNSIIGYAEIMLMGINGEMDPDTFEDVQAIYDNSQHLLCLINDVLDLTKIEANQLKLEMEEIDIQPLLEKAGASAEGLLMNKPVELVIDIQDNLPSFQGDSVRINQVLNNLVSNAIKFTEEGEVSLRAYGDNGWLCVEVKDTGIGISAEYLEVIFDRFRQVDSSHSRNAQGTGLGLAITRHLVELHGGEIEVQSQVGVGSTFLVRLPASVENVGTTSSVQSVGV